MGGFLIVVIGLKCGHSGGNDRHGGGIGGGFWPRAEEVDQEKQQWDKQPPLFTHVIKFPEYIKFLPTVVTATFLSRKSGCFDVLLPPNGNQKYSNHRSR